MSSCATEKLRPRIYTDRTETAETVSFGLSVQIRIIRGRFNLSVAVLWFEFHHDFARRKRMGSGDPPGLQNRRAAGLPRRRCVRLAHASAIPQL